MKTIPGTGVNAPCSGTSTRHLVAALAAYASIGFTPLAFAQDVTSRAAERAEEESAGEGIVVQGIRASLNSALDIKRTAATVVDAISSEVIGRYPDINLAESLQRISGVQISRNRGEGQSVNIRGMPAIFTQTTLNSRSVANALVNGDTKASRAFDFSILAPEFVRTLEVYKAPTADLEEGGLSGTVNIRTPRALEIGKRVLAGSVEGEYSDTSRKVTPRGSVLYADTFADRRLGITLGLSHSKREPQTQAIANSYFFQREGSALGAGTVPADLSGNGVIEPQLGVRIPGNINFALFREKRERISGIGAIEFQPTDTLKFQSKGFTAGSRSSPSVARTTGF